MFASVHKIVVSECVEALMQAEQYLPSLYVRISEWLIFLLCCLYKSNISDIVS